VVAAPAGPFYDGGVRSRIAVLLILAFAALVGCAHTAAPAASPTADSVVVSADVGAPDVLAAWSVYGLALAAEADKTGGDDFATEVTARGLLVDTWKETRASKHLTDAYLDLLVGVGDAGFMREYVLAYLARPGWTLTGDDLSRLAVDKWSSWVGTRLPKDHRAITPVTVHVRGLQSAPVPGADLPAPGEIDPAHTPCAQLQPTLDRALGVWDREERALRQVPLSIPLATQVLPTLAKLSGDPRARRDGVVLVSPMALELVFDAGFCAVDRGDWTGAERLLRHAVALSPATANVRGELVQALIMQKRPDEADAELDVALEFADSDCQRAMLWRKRGYILFDRGKLVDSYRAYARSLDFDPGNELARSEMGLIVATLRRAGTYDEKVLAPLIAPAAGKMRVTNCPR
jgi:tetratricopeptide (TPR) repeat protein